MAIPIRCHSYYSPQKVLNLCSVFVHEFHYGSKKSGVNLKVSSQKVVLVGDYVQQLLLQERGQPRISRLLFIFP